ncbi:MAG TPA: response regulator [Candidatus Limnocylindria bacterium]|nr:response regulator [Candidatus Limnocylindria bacterium]
MPADAAPSVLVVDDDHDIAEIVQAVLTDEGYAVSCLYDLEGDAVMRAIGRLEPDCVLLDSVTPGGYEEGWAEAATLALRRRRIPVVMFTAHVLDAHEARTGASPRAKAAEFAAVVGKPFNLDELVAAVATATGRSVPFDRSAEGETKRTEALVATLAQHGATDIHPSRMREWATFLDVRQRLWQIYWWQGHGVYLVGRYRDVGRMTLVGQFVDRDAAIEAALPGA